MGRFEDGANELMDKIKNFLHGNDVNLTVSEKDGRKNKELADKLKEMEELFNASQRIAAPDYEELYPSDSGLTYKEKEELSSDAELKRLAEEELAPSYNLKTDAESAGYEYKSGKLSAKEDAAQYAHGTDLDKLDGKLDALLENNQQAMIRRGLTHSSIRSEGEKSIGEYGAEELAKITYEYDAVYAGIKAEVDYLKLSYENSLKDYELKYAADLEKRINALKLAEEKRVKEIDAYNLKIAKAEEAYQKEREKQIAEKQAEIDKLNELKLKAEELSERLYGLSPEKRAEFENRYQTAYDFYSAYDKNTAMALISENYKLLNETLGGEYFEKLVREIGEK